MSQKSTDEKSLAKSQNDQTPARHQWHGPFSLFRHLNEEMDRMFSGRFMPQLEVTQGEGNLMIQADMRGMDRKDIHIEVVQGGLMLSGERRNSSEEKRDHFYRSERSHGSFQRFIPPPDSADVENVKASFKNGVLEVTIPNQPKTTGRKVEISDGHSEPVSSNEPGRFQKSPIPDGALFDQPAYIEPPWRARAIDENQTLGRATPLVPNSCSDASLSRTGCLRLASIPRCGTKENQTISTAGFRSSPTPVRTLRFPEQGV
jgi:HSP20 family protein